MIYCHCFIVDSDKERVLGTNALGLEDTHF